MYFKIIFFINCTFFSTVHRGLLLAKIFHFELKIHFEVNICKPVEHECIIITQSILIVLLIFKNKSSI